MIIMKIEYNEITKKIFIHMSEPIPLDDFKEFFNKLSCDHSLDMLIIDDFVLTGDHAKKFRKMLENPKPLTDEQKKFKTNGYSLVG